MRRILGLLALALCMMWPSSMVAAELSGDQKVAALTVDEVQSVYFAELVEVQIGDPPANVTAPRIPWKEIEPRLAKQAMEWIADPASYRFNGTAACFEPGMRIVITGKQHRLTLDVCLHCEKMSVQVDKGEPFALDFSDIGLLRYKSIYLDFVEQQRIKH